MDFINKQNGVGVLLDLFHNLLEALFKIATIPCASEQKAHVQRIHSRIGEDIWHFATGDLKGQPFGNRCFTNTRLTNKQRIIFLAAAKHLNGAAYFRLATNQRVNFTVTGLLV